MLKVESLMMTWACPTDLIVIDHCGMYCWLNCLSCVGGIS